MAISTIGTDALAPASVTSAKLASGAPSTSQLPAGTVLQVVSSTLTTVLTGSADTWIDVLSLSITPSSASSKILISYNVSSAALNNETVTRVLRNGSTLSGYSSGDVSYYGWTIGGQGASNYVWSGQTSSMQYLDSPATTSAITYKLQGYQNISTLYVNRSSGTNSGDSQGGITTITLMEIAA